MTSCKPKTESRISKRSINHMTFFAINFCHEDFVQVTSLHLFTSFVNLIAFKTVDPSNKSYLCKMNAIFVSSTAVMLLLNCVFSEAGNCPAFAPVNDFSLEQYLGKWYEIGRYPVWYETEVTCACTDYQVMKTTRSGKTMKVSINLCDRHL